MRIDKPLFKGALVRRYKRFLADVETEDGEIMTIHCPNSGAMTGCAVPGSTVYYSDSQNSNRKLRYTLELIEIDGVMICVNTHRANALVKEALVMNHISALAGPLKIEAEVPYGVENSRIDFLLTFSGLDCYVEVKNVSLLVESGIAAFPDAVSVRGQKHVRELIQVVKNGHRAALIYCVARTDAIAVRAAAEIDSGYAQLVEQARDVGVEVYALKLNVDLPELYLRESLPVLRMA